MSFLALTIPATLLLAAVLLWLVVRAARQGEFEDPEGPAERMLFDDDRCPELEEGGPAGLPGHEGPGHAEGAGATVRDRRGIC